MKKIYLVNNYSGVHVEGLKNSIYDLKKYYKAHIIEEREIEEPVDDKLKNINRVLDINTRTFEYANTLIKSSYVPVMVGGDHSIAIATVAATANNYDNIGLIWIDAHADINTHETTPSGNIHGMPIAAMLGICDERLNKIGGDFVKIKPENIVYLGLRSVDEGEVELLEKLKIKSYYYSEIQEKGLENVLNEVRNYLNVSNIHLSFDLDSMNPELIPGVSTPVDGGFNYDEVCKIFDFFSDNYEIKSYDFVEYNKKYDIENQTLSTLIKLIERI